MPVELLSCAAINNRRLQAADALSNSLYNTPQIQLAIPNNFVVRWGRDE